jgi:hypothetical protein
MGVRHLGGLGPRGGPGLGVTPPGITAGTETLETQEKRGKSSAKHLMTILLCFVHGDLDTNPVTNLARHYGSLQALYTWCRG